MLAGAAVAPLPARVLAQVPEWSLRAQQRLKGGDDADFAARQALLRDGESRLAAGDAAGAEATFDRAAAMLHAADTEIALVRTYMQLGQYRRALAFCAHTAGVHRDVVAAAALYVWLLHAGGQAAYAARRLAQAEQLYPGEPLLAAVRRQTASGWPRADATLRALPARLAPYAGGAVPPAGAHVLGSATLLAGGRHALAPADALAGPGPVWLRNGLGQTVEAHAGAVDSALGLVVLTFEAPLPVPAAAAAPRQDPFAGRAGYTLEYAAADDPAPAWPQMRLGFLGGMGRAPGSRRLGLEVPAGPRGGPVLDDAGRFVGVALAGQPLARMAGVSELRGRFGALIGPVAADAPAKVAPDQAYEHGLQLALQLIAAP